MSNIKTSDIISILRQKIILGTYAPGEQLPTRDQLIDEYQASRQTIQNALARLIDDGFAIAYRREGTFVVDHPPHLNHYGLVTEVSPSSTKYLIAMFNALENIAKKGGLRVSTYYCRPRENSDDLKRLIHDVTSYRFAGLIFPFPVFSLMDTPVIQQPGIPRIFNSSINSQHAIITLSHHHFLEKAIDHLLSLNRSRIAIIGTYLCKENLLEDAQALLNRGLSRPDLIQHCDSRNAWSSKQIVLMMLQLPPDKRPDALIIRDDNLVEEVTGAFQNCGISIPRDFTIIAHCNFPDQSSSNVPVTKLGLDCNALMEKNIENLILQRQGKENQKKAFINSVFDFEFDKNVGV